MYYNFHYSLFSEFERRYNKLNQNENIDIIKFTKQQSDRINTLESMRMLDKRIYNEFNQIEFLNYIPFDIFKTVVKDLYFIYIKEFPFGNIESYIQKNYGGFIYECETIIDKIERGKIIWWDSIDNFDFYNYDASPYDYRMISWITKSNDDPHFYSLYLKNIIEFLEKGVLKEIEQPETIKDTKHTHIFCNNGFELFEYLLANFVKPKGQKGHHKDVLFCYHKLFNSKPKYIHQKTQTFLDWYNPLYEDEINQTKTYAESKTISRESLYSTLLDLFKQQK
jgi:hypothetical protein